MEAKKTRSRVLLSTIFHVLHVCVSIGLVIAVVRYQLVNESRFERLESNACKCPNSEEKASKSKQSSSTRKNNIDFTTGHSLFKRTLDDQGYDTKVPELGGYLNKSLINNTFPEDTETSTSNTTASTGFKVLNSSDEEYISMQTKRNSSLKSFVNNTIQKEAETTASTSVSTGFNIPNSSDEEHKDEQTKNKSTSKEYTEILKYLGKDAHQLFSCLDKLKGILESQITTGNKKKESKDGCIPSQGLKGYPGEKGKPGQKGDKGSKGCSGTSLAPPTFAWSPRYLVFNEGDPAVLSCNATANPPAQITWYRDSVMLFGERKNFSHPFYVKDREVTVPASSRAQMCPSEVPHPVTQSTLIIKQSRGSDTGTYVCKARNILGVYSYKIQILVQVYVEFTKTPANLTVVQGDDVRLSCRASGVPTPVITWYRKDGGPMPSGYNITGGDLHIYEISKEEEGTFVCLATNVLGSKTCEATITVNVFPKITSFQDQPITVNESQTLILPCNGTGYPSPEIRWSKVNDLLPEGRYVHDSQMLNISRVKYEDRGKYVCTANNTVGRTDKKVKVIVQVGPKIIKMPNATEFGYRGRTKRLSFQVFSFPKATVTWKRPYWDRRSDGRFRQENGDLIIENVQYTDSGRYQATARNILGEVTVMAFLSIQDAVLPFLTTKPPKEVMTFSRGQTISLTCTAIGVPAPKVTWTNPDSNTMTSGVTGPYSSRTVNIGYFTPQKRGQYTCVAENDFGTAEAHVYLLINSDIRLISSSPDPYQGRVEVKRGGTWGTLCDRDWDMKHARIACKQLGFRNAASAFTRSRVGQAPGTVHRFICRGSETRLQECNTGSTYTYYGSYRYGNRRKQYICTQKVDAYIKCS